MLRRLGIILLLLVMTACQTTPKPRQDDESGFWLQDNRLFEPGLADLKQLSKWRYSAKVGVTTPKVREQANLVWRFADQANNVRLFGPLGAGAIKLEFDQYGVQLSDNQGVLHRGESAEALLGEIVGWPIPIDALSYWLFALPLPDFAYEYQLDDAGRLAKLRQLDWQISYSGYKPYAESGQLLARKLIATRQVGPDQHVTVKLVTKNWQWQ